MRSADNMIFSIYTIKHFIGKIGEKYSFKKKSNHQENPKLLETTVNKVMESIITNENHSASEEPISDATDEDDLMKLFNQLSVLMLSMSYWLELGTTIVISEASLQGKGTTYEVKIQTLITIAVLDTGANISIVSIMFFNSLPKKTKLAKVNTHNVMSVSGANLGPIGQCDLSFS